MTKPFPPVNAVTATGMEIKGGVSLAVTESLSRRTVDNDKLQRCTHTHKERRLFFFYAIHWCHKRTLTLFGNKQTKNQMLSSFVSNWHTPAGKMERLVVFTQMSMNAHKKGGNDHSDLSGRVMMARGESLKKMQNKWIWANHRFVSCCLFQTR